MNKNVPVSNDTTEGPIFSATKYIDYHITGQSVIDSDIEV